MNYNFVSSFSFSSDVPARELNYLLRLLSVPRRDADRPA